MIKTTLFEAIRNKEAELGRRITNREISEGAGVALKTVSQYRNGRLRQVKLDTLEKLANYLGCRPGDLLKESGE